MINKVTIQNYKSIKNLSIDLGGINVFIGANGSGKSNILEAIAIGAAAANRKLDNEFLALRGIRISDPRLMRNAFDVDDTDKPIKIGFKNGIYDREFKIINDNKSYSKWLVEMPNNSTVIDEIINLTYDNIETEEQLRESMKTMVEDIKELINEKSHSKNSHPIAKALKNFMIYSPENNELRKFETESQIEPLGIYGQGLFKLIQSMDENERHELKSNLEIIDWFEDFYVNENPSTNEKRIQLKDRYIDDKISFFDQRNANEGFLFLMFYLSLLISKHTPKIFGIDNVDNALNPKLCKDVLKAFVKLSEKYDKQVLLTTHNPAVLDGMNLSDPKQRLYVVFRNLEGMTKIKRIDEKSFDASGNVRLSEAFARGYIGGLNESLVTW